MIKAIIGDTTVGLSAIVTKNGVPQSGETVLLRIAEADVADSYLDFNDNTFKTAGWTAREVTMIEDTNEPGRYLYVWDSSVAVTAFARLNALYVIGSGANQSFDSDLLVIEGDPFNEIEFVRKIISNRMDLTEAASGNLIIYDDDSTTVFATMTVRDPCGNPIDLRDGMQASRTKASPGP